MLSSMVFSNVSSDRLVFLLISFLDLRKSVSIQSQILTEVRGGGVSVVKGFIKSCVAGLSYDRKWGHLLGYIVRLEPADYMGAGFWDRLSQSVVVTKCSAPVVSPRT